MEEVKKILEKIQKSQSTAILTIKDINQGADQELSGSIYDVDSSQCFLEVSKYQKNVPIELSRIQRIVEREVKDKEVFNGDKKPRRKNILKW